MRAAASSSTAKSYTRGTDGRWTLADYTALTDHAPLASIDCTLALAEVYDKLKAIGGKESTRM